MNLNKTRRYYFELASSQAKKSILKSKHGAIGVYKGEIVAEGYNHYPKRQIKNKEITLHGKRSVHAEASVILQCRFLGYNLREVEIYVVRIKWKRETGEYEYAYSRPCSKCTHEIIKNEIKTAFFSIDNKDCLTICKENIDKEN